MGSLFSRKKEPEKPKITEQDKAILALKQQRDKLKQYQKKIQLNLEKERQLAKRLLKDGKKDKAKLLLKKKRYQEQTLERTDNQLDNLEKMVQDVEFAQVQIQVADGLKQGNEALKKMHEIMSIEDVERIMDETREGIEYQREIDDLLSGSLTQEDEDAVLQELEEMTQQQNTLSSKFGIVISGDHPAIGDFATVAVPLPEVPTNEPGEKRPQKERVASREAEMVPA